MTNLTHRLLPYAVRVATLASILASSSVAVAASRIVAVLPPSGDNVAPAILSASAELLKDHLQRTGAYTVVSAAGTATGQEPTGVEAAEQARAFGAEQAIVMRVTHFGTSARIRLTAYSAANGQTVYWDSTVISGGPDELDTIIQRLVHAMQIGKPVRESAELDTVTDKEMQNFKRRAANKSFGVHLFTLLPFNTAGDVFRAVPGGGIFWLYDARSWMADIALDLGSRTYLAAAIGGYYPLLREDFTPYFGGVVRWAHMELGGAGASGISFQPTAGVLLGRLSSVQLRAEAGYFVNSFAESPATTVVGDPTSTSGRYSHGINFTMGLGF